MNILNLNPTGELLYILAFYSNENIVYMNYNPELNKFEKPESLTEQNFNRISKSFNSIKKDELFGFKKFIPKNVLYFSPEYRKIIWTTEPGVKKQIFKNDSIESGNYPVPKLLWKFFEGKLYVFALKENDDKLYQAPFLNTYSDGSICLGSIRFKFLNNDYEDCMRIVENNFFESYFTHTNTTNLIKGNLVEFYQNFKNKKKFPNDLLIELDANINDLL